MASVLGFGDLGSVYAQEDVEVINITIRPDPSLEAVIQARQAMQKKDWQTLEALVPRASQAPL
ncbi:MAG: hypothetical protein H5U29_15440, partial [Pusillimonas sp.]|nr:hypothetical protein [Pusillimonas sp.]